MRAPTLFDIDGVAHVGHCAHARRLDEWCPFCDPIPTARATDPETSHQAAKRATTKADTNRALALLALRARPEGLTDFELAEITGVAQTSIGVRRHELVKAGRVVKTDLRRPSPSGCAAIVWKAVR